MWAALTQPLATFLGRCTPGLAMQRKMLPIPELGSEQDICTESYRVVISLYCFHMLAWFWTFIQFYQYTLLTVVVLPNQHSEWIIRWVSQSSAFTCMWHTLCLSPILCGTWMNRMKYWIAVAECYSEKKSSSEMLSVGEMVSPGWFTSHVVCLSDCSIADSVRGTSEEAQGTVR